MIKLIVGFFVVTLSAFIMWLIGTYIEKKYEIEINYFQKIFIGFMAFIFTIAISALFYSIGLITLALF
jgi:uncharacterized protein YybS (DUF2232 family)